MHSRLFWLSRPQIAKLKIYTYPHSRKFIKFGELTVLEKLLDQLLLATDVEDATFQIRAGSKTLSVTTVKRKDTLPRSAGVDTGSLNAKTCRLDGAHTSCREVKSQQLEIHKNPTLIPNIHYTAVELEAANLSWSKC